MINKQLLGIIGAIICLVGIFLPAGMDSNCSGFFEYNWESPFLNRFTCAGNGYGNILYWWERKTYWTTQESWSYFGNEKLASLLLIIAILGVTAAVITKLYPIMWVVIPVIIACTIYLHGQLRGENVSPHAWFALAVGCILLIVSASSKEVKS